ncbi:MAG: hypothetical protein Q7T76_13845 [Ferruginibacter sp.]|nr:hypothetical protein [Ferruginibacter sp.]
MKDFKTSLLFLLSLLLLLAVSLLGTVVYHFYYRTPTYKPVLELSAKNDIIIASSSRDSLYQRYTVELQNLGNRLDTTFIKADSVNTDFESRINDFYRLREEIASILKKENIHPDLETAGLKIKELQSKLSSMQFVNRDIEAENKRLVQVIAQLKKQETNIIPQEVAKSPRPVITRLRHNRLENFSVSDLNFVAITTDEVKKQQETRDAKLADKWAGSFSLHHSQSTKDSEVMLVIVQPNGKVFQGSTWDVGSFATAEGKKIYSRKFNVDYKKGDNKKLAFSIAGDEFQAGTYVMQVYQNGTLIGRTQRMLL